MWFPWYIYLIRKNTPYHTSIEKNNQHGNRKQIYILSYNTAKEQEGSKAINQATCSYVICRSGKQPYCNTSEKISQEKNPVCDFIIKIEYCKRKEKKRVLNCQLYDSYSHSHVSGERLKYRLNHLTSGDWDRNRPGQGHL